jgi:hypothetical protein
MNVPDISKLGLPSTVLMDSARPTSDGKYKDIEKALVAGWLEMRDGTMTTEGTSTTTEGTSTMQAEFRPATTVKFIPIRKVQWKTPNLAPCLIVTPFGGTPGVVVFNEDTSPIVRYENLPAGHSHGRAFASYDFELLYDVLDEKPAIPPIPHQVFLNVADEAKFLRHCVRSCADASAPQTGDPVSGVNCGPGTNPNPGDPKP